MRALLALLGLVLVALMATGAAAQTATVKPEATPQWDIKAFRTKEGGVHCYYYKPGTLIRERPLIQGPAQRRASRFQQVEKFEPNMQMRAFAGEPVIREQPLREYSVFAAPKKFPRVAEKWAYFETPTRLPAMYPAPAPVEEPGRGGRTARYERPPTYIGQAQGQATNFRHFEKIGECLYVRPEFPSPLQQVNNRQFSPQWHF